MECVDEIIPSIVSRNWKIKPWNHHHYHLHLHYHSHFPAPLDFFSTAFECDVEQSSIRSNQVIPGAGAARIVEKVNRTANILSVFVFIVAVVNRDSQG